MNYVRCHFAIKVCRKKEKIYELLINYKIISHQFFKSITVFILHIEI